MSQGANSIAWRGSRIQLIEVSASSIGKAVRGLDGYGLTEIESSYLGSKEGMSETAGLI